MIASVVQSTMYLNPVWDALSDEAKSEIVSEWAALIRSEPERAANLIIHDIAERPGFAEAWSRLTEQGQIGRRNCFTYLVAEAEPSSA